MRFAPLLLALALQPAAALDVTTLTVGTPARIAEIDLGKLKGELRRLSWSPDAAELCIQTADDDRPADRMRTYLVAAGDGTLRAVDTEPDWAYGYWARKSDRYAPGQPSIEIAVEQRSDKVTIGTGSAGALDRESSGLGAGNVNSGNNVDRAAQTDRRNAVRLTLFGSTIGEFVNTRPRPGVTFGWGPDRSATMAFVDADGRLFLLDSFGHSREIPGVRNAVLPAWTRDGSRLAFLQKNGRKKYALMVVVIQPRVVDSDATERAPVR